MDSITNLLEKLRDIHLPEKISWWPLAPGWYVLIGVTFIVAFILFFYLGSRWLRHRAKRQALRELRMMQDDYSHNSDAVQLVAQISILLKRIALVYFPRHDVAILHGDEWVNFLADHVEELEFQSVRSLLVSGPYQRHTTGDIEKLIVITEKWIKKC